MIDKFYIIGHGRHGKDSFSEFLQKELYRRNLSGKSTFQSSSYACAELVRKALEDKYNLKYNSLEDCYIDRHSHRAKWFEEIKCINQSDEHNCGVSKLIFELNDIYCGIRNYDEVLAYRNYLYQQGNKVYPLMIWIDNPRIPPEDSSSMNISMRHSDVLVFNTGSLEDLENAAMDLVDDLESSRVKYLNDWHTGRLGRGYYYGAKPH